MDRTSFTAIWRHNALCPVRTYWLIFNYKLRMHIYSQRIRLQTKWLDELGGGGLLQFQLNGFLLNA